MCIMHFVYACLFTIVQVNAVILQNASEETAHFRQVYGDNYYEYYSYDQDRDQSSQNQINKCDPPKDSSKRCRKTYVFGTKLVDFHTAKAACEDMHMQLVSIENPDKWGDVVVAIQKNGAFHYWTSAQKDYRTGEFVWGNGCPVSYSRWQPGEPNNFVGIEDCIEIYPTFFWNDFPCVGLSTSRYICETIHCV